MQDTRQRQAGEAGADNGDAGSVRKRRACRVGHRGAFRSERARCCAHAHRVPTKVGGNAGRPCNRAERRICDWLQVRLESQAGRANRFSRCSKLKNLIRKTPVSRRACDRTRRQCVSTQSGSTSATSLLRPCHYNRGQVRQTDNFELLRQRKVPRCRTAGPDPGPRRVIGQAGVEPVSAYRNRSASRRLPGASTPS